MLDSILQWPQVDWQPSVPSIDLCLKSKNDTFGSAIAGGESHHDLLLTGALHEGTDMDLAFVLHNTVAALLQTNTHS